MDYWDFFADDALRTGSPLYQRLSQGTGGDEDLKALAAQARKGQPHANVLFAAVHFLLLRGADHRLAKFYPSVGGRASISDEDPFPLFRDFVQAHRGEIETLVRSRVTNTNEVGRSALLHPGFRAVAAAAGEPLNLIEIGPSAGLNMIWDSYGVRYMRDGAKLAEIAPEAPLVIEAGLRGEKLPPTGRTPAVARRAGLELNPTDLTNADDRDWLRALIWPDQVGRLERLARAITLFDAVRPEIRAGNALALLPDALAAIPESEPVCVYHTIAIYQFSRAMRQALEDILTVAGLRRPVWRLSFEYDAVHADTRSGGIGDAYLLSLMQYRDGRRDERLLAQAHPHGTWLEWLE